jgi:hypothetical protein
MGKSQKNFRRITEEERGEQGEFLSLDHEGLSCWMDSRLFMAGRGKEIPPARLEKTKVRFSSPTGGRFHVWLKR